MAEGKSQTRSAIEAYNVSSMGSAKSLGSQLMQKPRVNAAISELMEYHGMGRSYRIQKLKEHLDHPDPVISLKSLEISYKADGTFRETLVPVPINFEAILEHISPKGIEENGAIQFEIKADVSLQNNQFIRAGYSANADIVLASPNGGQPPLDPKSDEPDFQTEATERFKKDGDAQAALANTLILSNISPDDYDAVFYPGGHGPLWDLSEDRNSIALIETMYSSGKPVAAVCHAPAVLRHVKAPDGSPLIKGRSVTGFSNTEEDAVQLSWVVPFLLEDELKAKGAKYSKADDWHPYAITDGNLITGQNQA